MEDLTLKTVVIDAGHGGKDPGAVSKDGKSKEKTFTLDIAERLEALIKEKYPEVKVVLTRHDDTFISLDQRAEIANKCSADLPAPRPRPDSRPMCWGSLPRRIATFIRPIWNW